MTSKTMRAMAAPLASAFILAGAAGGALAQTASPQFDFSHLGEVSGLKAYEVSGVKGVWLISPDGNTVINGMVYDLSGETPLVNFKTASKEQLPQMLRRDTAAAPEERPEPPQPDRIVTETVSSAAAALDGVGDAKKRELLADLVARMDRAKSPDEFKLLILEWQAEIEGNEEAAETARKALTRLRAPALAPSGISSLPDTAISPVLPPEPEAVPDRAAVDALAESIAAAIPQTLMPGGASPASAQLLPAEEAASETGGQPDDAYLLNQMRHEGFWFAAGRQEAPVVYAFIDPMCPYCARAMKVLKPEIDSGALQLRVLLAPAVSRASPAKIASILLSEDPVGAFLTHELEYAARGASSLKDRSFDELPQSMNDGIRANYDMIHRHELPGVPFFAYETADGIKFLSGVPRPGHFEKALPDAYGGTIYQKSN